MHILSGDSTFAVLSQKHDTCFVKLSQGKQYSASVDDEKELEDMFTNLSEKKQKGDSLELSSDQLTDEQKTYITKIITSSSTNNGVSSID